MFKSCAMDACSQIQKTQFKKIECAVVKNRMNRPLVGDLQVNNTQKIQLH